MWYHVTEDTSSGKHCRVAMPAHPPKGIPRLFTVQYSGGVLSVLKLGVSKNLHVLLWKVINDVEKIRSQELQKGN